MNLREFTVAVAFAGDVTGESGVTRIVHVGAAVELTEWLIRSEFGLKTARFMYAGKDYSAPARLVYDSLEETPAF